ncbi:MAG: hypothetical protein WD426_17960 [Anditalea sp.]
MNIDRSNPLAALFAVLLRLDYAQESWQNVKKTRFSIQLLLLFNNPFMLEFCLGSGN